jgi:hypothetical protein
MKSFFNNINNNNNEKIINLDINRLSMENNKKIR